MGISEDKAAIEALEKFFKSFGSLFPSDSARLIAIAKRAVDVTAIDPGEGWELLPVGTVIECGDEYHEIDKSWVKSGQIGDRIGVNTAFRYRRKKPVEQWPKWYVHR